MSHEGYGFTPPPRHGPKLGPDEVAYFCPKCQSLEIEETTKGIIIGSSPNRARCLLCKWEGTTNELIGALAPTNEFFWTPEKVANALLIGASKYAAGPLVQLLEFIGLVPKIEGGKEEKQSARDIREAVVKAVLEAVVTASFETAAALSPPHNQRFHPELVGAIDHATGAEVSHDDA
jgi:hypothetical protein